MTLNSRQRRARRQARRLTEGHALRCRSESTTVGDKRPQQKAGAARSPVIVTEEEPRIQGTPKDRLPAAPPGSMSQRESTKDTQDREGHPPPGLTRICRPDEEATTFTRKSVWELLSLPAPLSYHEAKKLHVAKFLRDSSQYFGAVTPPPALRRSRVQHLLREPSNGWSARNSWWIE